MTDTIHNFTFDELTIGQVATMTRTLNKEDIAVFAAASWDTNPAHLDEEYAKDSIWRRDCSRNVVGRFNFCRHWHPTARRGDDLFRAGFAISPSCENWRHG